MASELPLCASPSVGTVSAVQAEELQRTPTAVQAEELQLIAFSMFPLLSGLGEATCAHVTPFHRLISVK
jgi:hypothetical protein